MHGVECKSGHRLLFGKRGRGVGPTRQAVRPRGSGLGNTHGFIVGGNIAPTQTSVLVLVSPDGDFIFSTVFGTCSLMKMFTTTMTANHQTQPLSHDRHRLGIECKGVGSLSRYKDCWSGTELV